MKAADVKTALRRRHDEGSGAWVCVEEAFSGFASGVGGAIDLLAIGAWASAKAPGLPGAGRVHRDFRGDATNWHTEDARYPLVAYEVKVTRADMRRELYGYTPGPNTRWRTRSVPPWPAKASAALERAHFFLFATPAGLLHEEEIERRERPADGKGLWLPPEAGLIEVDGRGCTVRAPAPRRAPRELRRGEIAELIRHAVNPNRQRALVQRCAYLSERVESLTQRVAELEHLEAVA